jgi:adenylate kinase family enzyme
MTTVGEAGFSAATARGTNVQLPFGRNNTCIAAAPVVISILGPPAVGKSTVTAYLASQLGASVFRLREFASGYRRAHPETEAWFNTDDPLGWFSDATAARILRIAFLDAGFDSWPVLLENLPGNATQLADTSVVLELLGALYVLVELTAPDDVLWQRAGQRRVCPTCDPEAGGDPHRPATGRRDQPDLCAQCNGQLVQRRSDDAERFAQRLSRYRHNIRWVRRSAHQLPLTYHTVTASRGVSEVLVQVQDVVQQTLDHAPTLEREQ